MSSPQMWLYVGLIIIGGGIGLWLVLRGIDRHLGKQISIPDADRPRHSQADGD